MLLPIPIRAFAVGVVLVAAGLVLPVPAAGAALGSTDWVAPVPGVVIDGFRPPAHIGAPGNRGWEYRTAPGSQVTASQAGRVAFAGVIGGQRYVSIDHRCGLRTTYSFLASIIVRTGDSVTLGGPIGTAGERMHFGLRRGREYLDPALLFAARPEAAPPRPHLVPITLA